MSKINKILVPTDLSANSTTAFEFARQLAGQSGAVVQLLHVTYETPYLGSPLAPGLEMAAEYRRQVKAAFDDYVAKLREQGFDGTSTLVEGVPHREIVRAAVDLGADLVVMGTHGRTGAERLLLGSVAERVVRTSHVPVLVVPPAPRP